MRLHEWDLVHTNGEEEREVNKPLLKRVCDKSGERLTLLKIFAESERYKLGWWSHSVYDVRRFKQ